MNKTTPAQESLQLATPDGGTINVENYKFEPIKGYPMLNWRGKRPFTSTQYYPAQLKEIHGEEVDGWRNKIFWGDNLQVMSHLLKEFRGQIDLIYIDPPFDSKADYKKRIKLRGGSVESDQNSFEEKQYGDIWNNDEYLQFLYERLVLLRELLTASGSIYVHCDANRGHYIKCLMDEVFGAGNFRNEIIWKRTSARADSNTYNHVHDTVFFYTRSESFTWNKQFTEHSEAYLKSKYSSVDKDGRKYRLDNITSPNPRPNMTYEWKGFPPPANGWRYSQEKMAELDAQGRIWYPDAKTKRPQLIRYLDESDGRPLDSVWTDIFPVNSQASDRLDYPTQKPVDLLERIIKASSDAGSLVFDCFMGSGTTQEAAMRLGRRFIGADINMGAIQTTTKRLLGVADDLRQKGLDEKVKHYTGFELHNVNHYDIFRNPVQAKELLIEALEVQKLEFSTVFDGEKDGRMVKIMPVNRIATRADLNELIAGFDYKAWERKQNESPNRPVEKITLVCMGHEPTCVPTGAGRQALQDRRRGGGHSARQGRSGVQRDSQAKVGMQEGRAGHREVLPDEPPAEALAAEGVGRGLARASRVGADRLELRRRGASARSGGHPGQERAGQGCVQSAPGCRHHPRKDHRPALGVVGRERRQWRLSPPTQQRLAPPAHRWTSRFSAFFGSSTRTTGGDPTELQGADPQVPRLQQPGEES
jgi:adenine-specific DNA-methyltransferase